MRNPRHWYLMVLTLLFVQGCSVGMALYGRPDPDFGALQPGQDREAVIKNLGQPSLMTSSGRERRDVFYLEPGNEPSYARAAGHAAMDVVTAGFWELIGTPIEGLFVSDKVTVTVDYDSANKVMKVATSPGHTPP